MTRLGTTRRAALAVLFLTVFSIGAAMAPVAKADGTGTTGGNSTPPPPPGGGTRRTVSPSSGSVAGLSVIDQVAVISSIVRALVGR